MSNPSFIEVRGAREHNLKSIDVDIPRNQLVVFTGLSGSGKSTLAIDTIYAEGQRRYVESLSAYARQFLNMMDKPDIDRISGLSPAISVEQKTTSRNPRSTVGTITEINDYLRVLYARVGIPHSPATGLPIAAQQVSDMVKRCLALETGTPMHILAPVVRDRKGEYRKELQEFSRAGFVRARVDGTVIDLDDPPKLAKTKRHTIELIVDRLRVADGIEQRLADSLRTALDSADGIVVVEVGEGEQLTFSEKFACPETGFTIQEIEPRLFSFNSHNGACPACAGIGMRETFIVDRIAHDAQTLLQFRLPFGSTENKMWAQIVTGLARHFGFSEQTRWGDLPPRVQQVVMHGGADKLALDFEHGGQRIKTRKAFGGLIPLLERLHEDQIYRYGQRSALEDLRGPTLCTECNGARLSKEALAVKIGGLDIAQFSDLSVAEALTTMRTMSDMLDRQRREVAASLIQEITGRLEFLVNVGLDYLTLSRTAGTLSGGESQRIRLASQVGAGLSGVLYVLDEPSIGLHQRDNQRLLSTLRNLQQQGNTVIVVEHDEEAIRAADWVIDIGPRAGRHGGQIVAQGVPKAIEDTADSLTGQYLSGRRSIAVPQERRTKSAGRIKIMGAHANNLKSVDVEFPLERFICVTGVSGSGKSTLTRHTLELNLPLPAVNAVGHGRRFENCREVTSDASIPLDRVVIDQRPIGRTPRSNPATYVGAFTPIREWYAQLPESRVRGYKPSRFSFNVWGGRCEACSGDGLIKIEMHFLSDVYVTCESCQGRRYNDETLEITFRDKSIADVLDMTIEDGLEFFSAIPAIARRLATLCKVGMGYVKIGQSSTTLSGGEAQRIKLSKELARPGKGGKIYILDEPTTGLHFDDIRNLLDVLHTLVDYGNTVVVIEHNLDVIKTADWVIDMGPEGGDRGGKVVAVGTPEQIAAKKRSHTGRFLKPLLRKGRSRSP